MSKTIGLKTCTPEMVLALPCTWSEDSLNRFLTKFHYNLRYVDEVDPLLEPGATCTHTASTFESTFTQSPRGEQRLLANAPRQVTHGPVVTGTGGDTCYNEFQSTRVTVLGDSLTFYVYDINKVKTYWSLRVWSWHQNGQVNVGVSCSFIIQRADLSH